jgi:hypothetical protein
MHLVRIVALGMAWFLVGCVSTTNGIDRSALIGAWASEGPSFDFDIRESTILYEFDMQEHPYTLKGDTLVVDLRSASLGIQRKRILSLTPELLILQDVDFDGGTEYRRVR